MVKQPTKADIAANTAKDLRHTYLYTFDTFATNATELSLEFGENTRYARELLGVLANANLIGEDIDGDGNAVWQVINPGTYDNHTRDEAEAVIDEWLTANLPRAEAKKVVKSGTKSATSSVSAEGTPCLCGCGEATGKKSNYRPGHDARHAGNVGRALVNEDSDDVITAALAVLPSELLREKAMRVRDNAITKIMKSTFKPDNKTEDGKVTVSKVEYAATRDTETGEVVYYKGDEIKTASKTAAKTFTS